MLSFLTAWWNAAFLLSFLVAIGLMAVTLVSGASHDGQLGDPSGGLDGPLGGDHLDAGPLDAGHLDSKDLPLLAALGVGRAPLSLLAVAFLLAFGSSGLIVNAVAVDVASVTPLVFLVNLVGSLVIAMLSTSFFARGLSALLPASDSDALQPAAHVGRLGVTESPVTPEVGQVLLKADARGGPAYIVARTEGDGSIPSGVDVYVASYDSSQKIYVVVQSEKLE